MIPKLETADRRGADAGVEGVVIMDGRRPHAMLLELFTEPRRRHPGVRGPMTPSSAPRTAAEGPSRVDLRHVDTWLFDLDNCPLPAWTPSSWR